MDTVNISVLIICITAFIVTTAILVYLGITKKADRKSRKEQANEIMLDKWVLYSIIFNKQPVQVNLNFPQKKEDKTATITTTTATQGATAMTASADGGEE